MIIKFCCLWTVSAKWCCIYSRPLRMTLYCIRQPPQDIAYTPSSAEIFSTTDLFRLHGNFRDNPGPCAVHCAVLCLALWCALQPFSAKENGYYSRQLFIEPVTVASASFTFTQYPTKMFTPADGRVAVCRLYASVWYLSRSSFSPWPA